ncbi:hypothetical protein AB4622_22430 [Vibrio splendidus]|uniref:hypothetical protein n=1 Tax=Vibrio sp. F12 TaxID=2070776 RepID=UPI0010BDBD3F|nr:hypothetical protein [Vibrio sp. F12]TKE94967.1 hypothetical protein FCV53_00420 [Vibrio sp. F12]
MIKKQGGGLGACVEAFERLKVNMPNNTEFKGFQPEQITPSVVSQEAGFDKGYLKKSRTNHMPLIALIEEWRRNGGSSLSNAEAIRRERDKASRYRAERDEANERYAEALGRELRLIKKIRELEAELRNYNVARLPTERLN